MRRIAVTQALLDGVVSGLLIALPAIGLSLTYGVLNFPNFAIGAMVTVGAYLAYGLNAGLGAPLAVASALAGIGLAVIAVAIQHLVYRPIGSDDRMTLLVASMGVAFVLENTVRFIYGAEVRTFDIAVARPLSWHGLRLNHEQLIIAVVAGAATLAVAVILKQTRLGRAMRAISDNPALAEVRGIGRARTIDWTWALAGVLTALAGVLIGMDATVEPLIGTNYLITVFAAAIVGGIGNPLGAMAGGLIIGVVEEFSTLILPSTYRQGVSFLMLVLVLFMRPHGLFGVARISR
jgi:branched-chain amino acid transport system permease protein